VAIVWLKVVSADTSRAAKWVLHVTACLPRSPKRKISLQAVFAKR
jgi:hypothetical protein